MIKRGYKVKFWLLWNL